MRRKRPRRKTMSASRPSNFSLRPGLDRQTHIRHHRGSRVAGRIVRSRRGPARGGMFRHIREKGECGQIGRFLSTDSILVRNYGKYYAVSGGQLCTPNRTIVRRGCRWGAIHTGQRRRINGVWLGVDGEYCQPVRIKYTGAVWPNRSDLSISKRCAGCADCYGNMAI